MLVGLGVLWVPGTRDLLSVQLAVRVGDQVFSTVVDPPEPRLSKAGLIEMLRAFLSGHGVGLEPWRGAKRVVLVAHDVASVLGVFGDPFSDFFISPMGRGHLAVGDLAHPADGAWKIWLVDLLGYFSTRLDVIGAAIGWPKIGIGSTRIEVIKKENPELFRASGRRDAEIALVAFLHLRHLLFSRWGVDAMNHGTPAAIGGEIFRSHYFRTAAAPYRTTHEEVSRRRKNGTWGVSRKKVHSYSGDLAVRDLAIRTLHGGRNEAFIRGTYPHRVVERDVRSMYPHAAKATGLPNFMTKWQLVDVPTGCNGREGFAFVRFTFPSGTERPCLPVRLASDRLFFPLAGESHCTFAEVRLALRLGASIEIIKAYGFTPGPRELDHELGQYLSALLAEKNGTQRGSLAYLFFKDLLNQPLGKLGQKSLSSSALAIERLGRQQGHPGVAAVLAQRPRLTGNVRGDPDLGPLWMPEQLGLILGKARALIGEILVAGKALSVSTDAVIIDAGADVECPALDELRAVGSDMPVEVEGDALFIGRARQYAILVRAEGLSAHPKVLAKNQEYGVVKAARLGSAETAEQFSATVLACIEAGANVAPTRIADRALKPEAAVRAAAPIGSPVKTERTTRFDWDHKRVLADRDCNPFRSYTSTRPYQTKGRRDGAELATRVRSGEARRRQRPVSAAKRALIIDLLRAGTGVREVARQMKVAASTISGIKAKLHREGGGGP